MAKRCRYYQKNIQTAQAKQKRNYDQKHNACGRMFWSGVYCFIEEFQ